VGCPGLLANRFDDDNDEVAGVAAEQGGAEEGDASNGDMRTIAVAWGIIASVQVVLCLAVWWTVMLSKCNKPRRR